MSRIHGRAYEVQLRMYRLFEDSIVDESPHQDAGDSPKRCDRHGMRGASFGSKQILIAGHH